MATPSVQVRIGDLGPHAVALGLAPVHMVYELTGSPWPAHKAVPPGREARHSDWSVCPYTKAVILGYLGPGPALVLGPGLGRIQRVNWRQEPVYLAEEDSPMGLCGRGDVDGEELPGVALEAERLAYGWGMRALFFTPHGLEVRETYLSPSPGEGKGFYLPGYDGRKMTRKK